MRKHQQRQILELLKTVEEAQSAGMYAVCQDGAVSVGEFIETIEGEGTQTVKLLEEYCELVFKANKGRAREEQLREQIIKIENSIKNELKPTRYEVVFFPYQLSMWDSLESIYLAAKEDPNCDAYVVPIPYYEKNPNGAFGKMHYDGDKYPDNIGAVDWKSYDIEARHPDIAYIHYAYDEMTTNASVHPNFYSKRLRQHCEKLVYVPYYVTAGDTVEEYYGYLPGILYSDLVVAQSEAVRQSFISHYLKYDSENEWNGYFGDAEEKFIALGSPKFDKVINAKYEDYELPEEWERLLAKPDGTRKKAILFNTHMFAWINGGEQYFRKIRSVFETFRNRDDTVLWWRPHPNTELNFRTLRPQLLSEYASVVSEYIEGGWGIYDDTPDLHRAIAWTDAYYGDGSSSLVALYKATGKPVLTQLIADPYYCGICADNGSIWLLDTNNSLYKYNKQKKAIDYLGMVPGKSLEAYTDIEKNDDKLYFVPNIENNVSIFDIEKKVFRKTYFDDCEKADNRFRAAVSLKDCIYFLPYQYPAIMRLNTDTNDIEYFSEWADAVEKEKTNIMEECWKNIKFWHYCVVDTEIVMTIVGSNSILFFDMESCCYEIRSIGEKSEQYLTVCHDGQDFYLSSVYENYVVKWNRQSGTISKILFPVSFSRKDNTGGNCFMVYINQYVWLIPYSANNAYKIDVETNEITEVPELTEHFGNINLEWYYRNAFFIDNCIYAATLNMGVVEYNTDSNEAYFINDFQASVNAEISIILSLLDNNENNYMQGFNDKVPKSGDAGKTIHSLIIKEV